MSQFEALEKALAPLHTQNGNDIANAIKAFVKALVREEVAAALEEAATSKKK